MEGNTLGGPGCLERGCGEALTQRVLTGVLGKKSPGPVLHPEPAEGIRSSVHPPASQERENDSSS